MKRLLLLPCIFCLSMALVAQTIQVKNLEELKLANKNAKPGDIIVLQDGNWENVTIDLTCVGTKAAPILFRAETAGKVRITGLSQLRLGGEYIVVEGLYFTEGYAGPQPVINFRINKNQLANHCRVTNTVIDNFNNPKRMEENNWVAFYGKHNRLDHCSFRDKKNMGVLLAVILDDERSRENYHEIDHNYFGRRPALASNGGEIIRVGVSQHCEFNSHTRITENFFEHCDGETEIVSIKSGSNLVMDNIFKESQGSLVLRHGDNNLVAGNFFIGNGMAATGGVRVINKGQIVRDNMFFRCRGLAFNAPLAVMNGIPNSPANRYVQVTDALIKDNLFYDCSPLSFGEGSDAERTLAPERVVFTDNIIYRSTDSLLYTHSDKLDGIRFANNYVSATSSQALPGGFSKIEISNHSPMIARKMDKMLENLDAAIDITGAGWWSKRQEDTKFVADTVECSNAEEIYIELKKRKPVVIRLTSKQYRLHQPLLIQTQVRFTGVGQGTIQFQTGKQLTVFMVSGNGNLELANMSISGKRVRANHLIASDTAGLSNHYNLSVKHCSLKDFDRKNGCISIFHAYKNMVADSLVFRNNTFASNKSDFISMIDETDDKGYYNAEKIIIKENTVQAHQGYLMNIYRGGNDESTLGPDLLFTNNSIQNVKYNGAIIYLTGVQASSISHNSFKNVNNGEVLVEYRDNVRASHLFKSNDVIHSGQIKKNQFVTAQHNSIQP